MSAAWTRKEGKNPAGGLNAAGRASYKAETGGTLKAPVKAGDTVQAHCTITNLIPEKKFIELKTQCLVAGKVVVDGEAVIMVPSRAS